MHSVDAEIAKVYLAADRTESRSITGEGWSTTTFRFTALTWACWPSYVHVFYMDACAMSRSSACSLAGTTHMLGI